jgi:beta-glucanase (GH16 family)
MKFSITASLLLIAFISFGSGKSSISKSTTSEPAGEKYELVWSDEFDYSGLPDSKKWSYDTEGNAYGWGNNEAQKYTKAKLKNSQVKDGFLTITAIKEDSEGKKYTSARLITKSKGDWLYGKIEVRAKLPEGRGMWPAIWMLPTKTPYGGWPACGEIDIMENVGYDPYVIVASAHTKAYNHSIGTHKNSKITIAD